MISFQKMILVSIFTYLLFYQIDSNIVSSYIVFNNSYGFIHFYKRKYMKF